MCVCVYETSGPTGRPVPPPATVNNNIHNIEQKILIFLIALAELVPEFLCKPG